MITCSKRQGGVKKKMTGRHIAGQETLSQILSGKVKPVIIDHSSGKISLDQNNFWNQIKKCYPAKEQKINFCKVFNVNGSLTSDTNIIVKGFCTFFTDIGKSLQSSINSIGNSVWKYHSTSQNTQNLKQTKSIFEFKEVCLQDLLKILKELKTSKSAGYDNIPASLNKRRS